MSTSTLLGLTAEPARAERRAPLPVTRPPARGSALVTLVVAAVVGLGAGLDAQLTAAACAVVIIGAVLLLRLEWAALLVIAVSVFEDYFALLTPFASKGAAVVLLASWLIRRGWRRLHHEPRSPVLVVAGVFTLVLLLSLVLQNNGVTGADIATRYLGFLAVLLVLVDVMRGGFPPARVATFYVWVCVLASCFAFATFWTGADRRAGGPVGDPNDFAFFLVGALPLAVVLRSTARRPWLYDLAAGVMLVTTALTLSRGALVAIAAIVAVGAVTRVFSLRSLLVGAVVAATLGAIVVAAEPDLVGTSLEQKANVADDNVTERLDLWQAAGAMTLDDPVLGQGPGAFSLYHQDYLEGLPTDVRHDLDVAHNTYLEISAELGLVGLAVWVALLLTAMLSAWSRHRRDRRTRVERLVEGAQPVVFRPAARDPLAGGVLLALVGLAAGSFFVTEQYFLPLWLMMALAAALLQPAPSTSSVLRTGR